MKNFVSNIFIAALTNILSIFTGIAAQYFVLNSYGSEINGLTSSVNQILIYLTLLEAGIGAASIQALYKPIVGGDHKKRDAILSATNLQYRKVGLIFFVLLIIISLFMPLITNSSLESYIIILTSFLMGLALVLNYLFIGRYRVLLQADKRIYVLNTLDSTLGIVFAIIRIALINAGFDIITVQLVALLNPLFRMIFLHLYVKKKYPDLAFKAEPDFKSISKSKNVLIHQAVGMVTQHTDVTILTLSSSLSAVSVYSVYNLIYAQIINLLSVVFGTAPQASFGHLLESKNPRFSDYYKVYEVFFTALILAVISTALVLTLPFISLYTASATDIKYIDLPLAILFATSSIFNAIRLPSIIMVNVTGTFKETQRGAIIEAIINIAISIPAYFIWGMHGLLLGTIVALMFRSVDIIYFNYKHIVKMPPLEYIKIAALGATLVVAYCGFFLFLHPITVSSWGDWLINAIISFIIAFALFFGVYSVAFRKQTLLAISVIKKFMHRKSKMKG